MSVTESLGNGIYQVSLVDLSSPYRTSGYIILADKIMVIETGSAKANSAIQTAFTELDIKPEQVDFIAVTHVHLDHAGGAGVLMSQCPNARLLIHKSGAKHMINPDKLIAGAKAVYGSQFETLFDPILPVPEERVDIMNDLDTISLGNNHEIQFMDTPGHAFHHLVLFDSASRGLFSGDAAGIFFKGMADQHGIRFCLPVTAPSQFEPNLMEETYNRLIQLNPQHVYFTHFGMADQPIDLLESARELVGFFGRDCVERYQKERSFEGLFDFIKERLLGDLKRLGIPDEFPEKAGLDFDIGLNIQGIIAYVEKLEKPKTDA